MHNWNLYFSNPNSYYPTIISQPDYSYYPQFQYFTCYDQSLINDKISENDHLEYDSSNKKDVNT
jgi:hypothetical protein